MRWRRQITGRLGEPVERGIPTVPERLRLPALVVVLAVCLVIFISAVVYGLHHG
jgi:hypothetical protein